MDGQTTLRIDDEFRALIPPLSKDELDGLEASILSEGCRDPIVVWGDVIIDGHNRYAICAKHGKPFATTPREFANRDAVAEWMILNQFGRRNLTPFVRAQLALKLEPLIAARAKANQIVRKGKQAGTSCQKSDELKPVDTKRVLADKAGISHDTLAKAKVLTKKADEQTKAKLASGEVTINQAYKAVVKAEKRAEQVKAVESATLPAGKYHVIVADPPWAYESRAADPSHRSANPYPSMSIEEICQMPVGEMAHDDCILWLWTTNAFMAESYEVAKRWGFTVKTILTWAKDRMGTGDWLRGQTEHCLMCVKGKPVVTLTNQTTLLRGPLREHSRKPDEFYALVESLCPGTKCELFSRQSREGWPALSPGSSINGRRRDAILSRLERVSLRP